MSADLKVAPSPTLADVRSQFAAWRATRPAGRRIPEPLWQLATHLLSSHSAAQVARELGLNAEYLRRRASTAKPATPPRRRRGRPSKAAAAPAFIELTPDSLATHARRTEPELRLVVERADGTRVSLAVADAHWDRVEVLLRSLVMR
jgi:hypothetical protein